LDILTAAIRTWNQHTLGFIVQLGDLLDGFCAQGDQHRALQAVQRVQQASLCKTWHNIIGNHELYNFTRCELRQYLNTNNGGDTDYYCFSPLDGWRFIVLDAYDVAVIGVDKQSATFQRAYDLLKANNTNDVLSNVDWVAGLDGEQRRFLPYNGALGAQQLEWLAQTLDAADRNQERVMIFSHIPLHICCTKVCVNGSVSESVSACVGADAGRQFDTLIWNKDEVLDIIYQHQCVVAVLAGHDHQGGFGQDQHGITHIVPPAPLECEPGLDAFGIMHIYRDRAEFVGYGKVQSTTIPFRPIASE
jgi:manganese-dependent ADP-ribose/CDP-alcohol diphosphatase